MVFSTIAENIRSFFSREEELSTKPKSVPETAREVFDRPQPAKIIEKPLPQKAAQLPFSPDELRSALKAQAPKPEHPQAPRRDPQDVQRDITHEIAAFETVLQSAPVQPVPRVVEPPKAMPEPLDMQRLETRPRGEHAPFFDEFEQFLEREDLETEAIFDKDLVWRMKEFHRHRLEGKEYYIYSKDVQQAVQRKLHELKDLERAWFAKRDEVDRVQKQMELLEREIDQHASDLRHLVIQARAKSRLERTAPKDHEFVLSDGRKLRSLLELKAALRNMPEGVFEHHVTSYKNDFATWVREAIADPQLADEMGPIRDRHQLELYLQKLGN